MGNSWKVGEGSQSEGVVIVPMRHDDGGQLLVSHARQRLAKRSALVRTRSGINQQTALRTHDESKVHRLGLGHSDIDTRSHLMPWAQGERYGGFDSRWRLGHHARLALCLCECQTPILNFVLGYADAGRSRMDAAKWGVLRAIGTAYGPP